MLVLKNSIFILTLLYAGYYDYKDRIIPDKVHLLIIISSFFANFNLLSSILGLFILPIFFIVPVFYKEDSIGGGDIKIVGAIGFFLGFGRGIIAIIAALFIAIIFNLWVLKRDRFESFPLAPYIAIGSFISLII
ncbi:A24 family peptidase [Tissierella praeacuta]|uniref:A24 family peptidase n=1 Tax=Tissierella praeacuta TaxID=43131 RepID=UPI0028B2207B|nr:A24 family peptidase [Tissierella praeacuta]